MAIKKKKSENENTLVKGKSGKPLIELKVLMIGARRCGKSSALYAMIRLFEQFLAEDKGAGISMQATEVTRDIFENRFKEKPEDIFAEKKTERWLTDENPDNADNTYEFALQVKNTINDYLVSFTDVPGEWFAAGVGDEEKRKLKAYFKESNIIMVCIDTPHLVEGKKSPYNIFNFPKRILSYLTGLEYDFPRLVLFVPMKCEKYYYKKLTGIDMTEQNTRAKDLDYVREIVKIEYKNFIQMAKQSNAFTVAITPILTLGDVIFDDFDRDAEGRVKRLPKNDAVPSALRGRPENAWYKFYSETGTPVYHPKYCEQPMLYILCYILCVYENSKNDEAKKKEGFTKKVLKVMFFQYVLLYNVLKDIMKDVTFVNAVEQLCRKHMIINEKGFELVVDPLNITAKLS